MSVLLIYYSIGKNRLSHCIENTLYKQKALYIVPLFQDSMHFYGAILGARN